MDNTDLYVLELKKAGFFSLLRAWLISQLCSDDRIQVKRALDKGMTLNKYSFVKANGNDVVWLNPNDVECFWTDGSKPVNQMTPEIHVRHMVRTKSGKEFELSETSWLKVMYGVDHTLKK